MKQLTKIWNKPIEEASKEELIEALQIMYEANQVKEEMLKKALETDLVPRRILD